MLGGKTIVVDLVGLREWVRVLVHGKEGGRNDLQFAYHEPPI